MKKKLLLMLTVSAMCLAIGVTCFATEPTGVAGFVSAVNDNITQDAMWNQVTPFAPLMVTIFLFAFGYMIFRRVTKAGSKGKFKA